MKRLLLVVGGILLGGAGLVWAAEGGTATGFEQITVSSTAIGLTAANYDFTSEPGARTKRVTCAVESNSIRFRIDGTNPTASVGWPANAGDQVVLDSYSDIINFKAIRQSSDATLSCTYWR